jgi:hypothetical protein
MVCEDPRLPGSGRGLSLAHPEAVLGRHNAIPGAMSVPGRFPSIPQLYRLSASTRPSGGRHIHPRSGVARGDEDFAEAQDSRIGAKLSPPGMRIASLHVAPCDTNSPASPSIRAPARAVMTIHICGTICWNEQVLRDRH